MKRMADYSMKFFFCQYILSPQGEDSGEGHNVLLRSFPRKLESSNNRHQGARDGRETNIHAFNHSDHAL